MSLGLASPVARAADDRLRIGVIASYTGGYADYGRQFDAGMAVYLKEHGGKIGGRPVEIITRDTGGAAPALAKRFAQELVVQDKVHVITGLDFSPNAYAVAAVASQARVPVVVMNAAASGIPASSPYVARVSFTVAQVTAPLAGWTLKQGLVNAFTLVADYAPGLEAEAAFAQAFVAGGGKLAGGLRVPMSTLDFSAYVQRIKDVKPQVVFFFFPSGVMPPAFLKSWKERGMADAGIQLVATGEATDDSYLEATGDLALGLVTSHHYSYAHPSEKNRRFVRGFDAEKPESSGRPLRASYFAVAAYDGLAAIDLALARTGGDVDADKLMEAFKGLKFESPRGPIEIDAATRDVVQTVYIRRAERVNGQLVNVEFDRYERMRDTAK